ncbi:MAG: DUF4870 domain-containing protein [Candidatus Methanofastidiosia archaeon]
MERKNLLGAISYLFGILSGILIYLLEKDDFVRFHARQSIVFSLIFDGLALILGAFSIFLRNLIILIGLILWLFLMFKALSGERYALPIIKDIAKLIP